MATSAPAAATASASADVAHTSEVQPNSLERHWPLRRLKKAAWNGLPTSTPKTFFATYGRGVAELSAASGELVRMLHTPAKDCADSFVFDSPSSILVTTMHVNAAEVMESSCNAMTRVDVDTGEAKRLTELPHASYSVSAGWLTRAVWDHEADTGSITVSHGGSERVVPAPANVRLGGGHSVNRTGALAIEVHARDYGDVALVVIPPGGDWDDAVVIAKVSSGCDLRVPVWLDDMVDSTGARASLLAVEEICAHQTVRTLLIDPARTELLSAEAATSRTRTTWAPTGAALVTRSPDLSGFRPGDIAKPPELFSATAAGLVPLTGWLAGAGQCLMDGHIETVCEPRVAWRPYQG